MTWLQYGKVYLATYDNGIDTPKEMAVKLVRSSASAADKEEFLGEAELMLAFDHPNVLRVRTAIQPPHTHPCHTRPVAATDMPRRRPGCACRASRGCW